MIAPDPRNPQPLAPDRAETILDSVADGVFTIDLHWRITFFNQAAERITGIPRDEALGRPCCEVFRADICENYCALKQTTETGIPVVNRAATILRADGRRVPISISTALLRDGTGRVMGGVETFRDLSLVEALRKELTRTYSFADIISRSHAMKRILTVLPKIAESESTVLISGESGTGKEITARAIHSLSPRKDRPFVAVNCGALPETLLESELFGHVAGAFTGATRNRAGRFQQAERGTLFLDEIGDITPALQIRLLRVLQEREFEPVGSGRSVKADVRVLCASHRNLEELVREGCFRQDLYYRVNVVKVTLPPLRDRKEDIPLLVEHFISRLKRIGGREITGVSPEVMTLFMGHDWPGNVRELENAIEHGAILAQGELIDGTCLPDHLRPEVPATIPPGTTLAEVEARAVLDALRRNDWKRQATADELGINKTTLWRKMKRLDIQPPR